MNFKYSILSLALVGLVGCATSSDVDYVDQASNITTHSNTTLLEQLIAKQQVSSESLDQTTEIPIRITELVDIPELNTFIENALQNNPSLQQSVVALKLAYAQQGITSSDRLPTLDGTFTADVEEDDDNSYTTDLTVSWELDLWQQIADSSHAAEKDIETARANLQSARDLVAANVMRGWLEISLNQQLINIEKQRLTILENNEDLILDRYRAGLGSLEELDNAKSSSASTRATLSNYIEQLAQSKRSLTLLSGQWTGEELALDIPDTFPEVLNPLSEMSNQNLSRRPDLQAAFFDIEAETLRTDAAYKAMLPSISLSASLTDIAESPSEVLVAGPLWSALGQISAPLFQGGELKAEAEMAELTTEQSYWLYQETLLTAVNEVENAIGQESSLIQQQQHLSDALASAHRSFASYEEKYRQGLVDIFDLLTVQQTTFDLETQVTETLYNRLINRIDLGLALGLGVNS